MNINVLTTNRKERFPDPRMFFPKSPRCECGTMLRVLDRGELWCPVCNRISQKEAAGTEAGR